LICGDLRCSGRPLECYEVAGLIDASQCSVNQTAQVVSQLISDFLPTISRYFNIDPLPKTINTASYG